LFPAGGGLLQTRTPRSPRANRAGCSRSAEVCALRGKHVGLITNHTGLDSQGRSTADVLSHAAGVQLAALFSPEHGLAGRNDEKISSTKDPSTGLPVYSLYGDTLRPTEEMLKGIDALVFDVQDAGVRFYTYTATMAYCMEEAAKHNIAFFVLDRPNPLGVKLSKGRCSTRTKRTSLDIFLCPFDTGSPSANSHSFSMPKITLARTCTSSP